MPTNPPLIDPLVQERINAFINGPGLLLALAAIAVIVIAGLVGLFVQLELLKKSKGSRKEDRRTRGKAVARDLAEKVTQIHADLAALQRALEEAFEDGPGKGEDREAWQIVQPLARPFQTVAITADELSVAKSVGGDTLQNQLLRLVAIHSGAVRGAADYSRRRMALDDLLPADTNGYVGAISLTREQILVARSEMLELNDLVEALRKHLSKDVADAAAVMVRLQVGPKARLGLRSETAA